MAVTMLSLFLAVLAFFAAAEAGQPLLIAGGSFRQSDGAPANYLMCWNGSAWTRLGSGPSVSHSSVYALVEYRHELVVGGFFATAGGVNVSNIARWNSVQWLPLGEGFPDIVADMVVVNDTLVVAGGQYVALWNGTQWRQLAPFYQQNALAQTVTVWNGQIVVGGTGFSDGHCLTIWNEASYTWVSLNVNVSCNEPINDMVVYHDYLVLAGGFTWIGNVPANYSAKVNETHIVPLHGVTSSSSDHRVVADLWHDDLYFADHGRVLHLNESSDEWRQFDSHDFSDGVDDIIINSTSTSTEVFVAGRFRITSGNPGNLTSRWDAVTSSRGPIGQLSVTGGNVYVLALCQNSCNGCPAGKYGATCDASIPVRTAPCMACAKTEWEVGACATATGRARPARNAFRSITGPTARRATCVRHT